MKKGNRMIITILGLIAIAIALILIIGIFSYDQKIEKEKKALFATTKTSVSISEEDLNGLPKLMKDYLLKVGVVGKPRYCNVVFRQSGTIKTDPKKDWLQFKATQYVSSENSGFIWKAKAFPIFIRDKFQNGQGEVKVNLLGVKNLAVISTPETDQSSLGRYFGELLWFPMGFLDDDITWVEIDDETIKGTIVKGNLTFEGYFLFNKEGLITAFRGKRYRDLALENFRGEAQDYVLMSDILIPKTMTAIWELEQGDLEYFKAAIIGYEVIDSDQ